MGTLDSPNLIQLPHTTDTCLFLYHLTLYSARLWLALFTSSPTSRQTGHWSPCLDHATMSSLLKIKVNLGIFSVEPRSFCLFLLLVAVHIALYLPPCSHTPSQLPPPLLSSVHFARHPPHLLLFSHHCSLHYQPSPTSIHPPLLLCAVATGSRWSAWA
jgi:hypothetical protein